MLRLVSRCLYAGVFALLASGCQPGSPAPPPGDVPAVPAALERADGPLNVLFIAVDDLRPALGAYGDPDAVTPHMDRLAQSSTLFERAYANVPVCGASRASLLTGLRPTPERFLHYYTRADEDAPEVPTLPEYLRAQGYRTVGLGKIFHTNADSPESWSAPHWHPGDLPGASPTWRNYLVDANNMLDTSSTGTRGPIWERADVPDSAYYDGKTAREATRRLSSLAQSEEPFFLAVGFLKPHLPFNAPDRYWELHPYDEIELPAHDALPLDAPGQAAQPHGWGEMRTYGRGVPRYGPLPDSLARRMVQGYRAATSYIDAQIGVVLDALEREGLAESTVVMLWGDHGFSLGEHGLWSKHSPFEVALRVPLMIRVPGQTPTRVQGLAELVDLYPTLVDLLDVPEPGHLQGRSLAAQLRDPGAPGVDAAFARYQEFETVRTDRYRYSAWYDQEAWEAGQHDAEPEAGMLYEFESDPDETVNVLARPEHTEAAQRLRALQEHHRTVMLRD